MQANLKVVDGDNLAVLDAVFSSGGAQEEKLQVLADSDISSDILRIQTSYSDTAMVWDAGAIQSARVAADERGREYEFDISASCDSQELVRVVQSLSEFVAGQFYLAIWYEDEPDQMEEYHYSSGLPIENENSISGEGASWDLFEGKKIFYIPDFDDDEEAELYDLIEDYSGCVTEELSAELDCVISSSGVTDEALSTARARSVPILTVAEMFSRISSKLGL